MGVVLDSTLFVDLVRGRRGAIRKVEELDARPDTKVVPTPVVYELLGGIIRTRSRTQAAVFRSWISRFHTAPLDMRAAEEAARLRAEFLDLGRAKSAVDILTAGIALVGGHTLISRDRDFAEIAEATGLLVEGYSVL